MSYANGYRREHSDYLREIFDISPNGVDYHNDFNIAFEFKESFMIKEENIFYKVPEFQVKVSDFFIFCLNTRHYFLVDKRDISEHYKFNTKKHNANIRINKIKLFSFFITDNVFALKDFIDKIEEVMI